MKRRFDMVGLFVTDLSKMVDFYKDVIGIPIDATALNGMDALLSTVQMPPGIPVGTVAIGEAGAKNAALLALRILSVTDQTIEMQLEEFKEAQRKKILGIQLK